MRKAAFMICNLGVWIICILLLLLSMGKSNQSAYEILSGIEASSVRGSADYKSISQWICLALPLYLTTGFWLYQHQPVRKYLLIRCHNYQRWCVRMAAGIICQIVGYYMVWGAILAAAANLCATSIWKCLLFRIVCTVPVGMLLLIIWEFTENAGSMLVVIFLEFAVIASSYLTSLKVQRTILRFTGMYRYVTGLKEYLFILAAELLGSILMFILLQRFRRALK